MPEKKRMPEKPYNIIDKGETRLAARPAIWRGADLPELVGDIGKAYNVSGDGSVWLFVSSGWESLTCTAQDLAFQDEQDKFQEPSQKEGADG